jgi:hypothetical protein
MFRDNDPYLEQLRAIALALPEATEVVAWGRPTFRAGKMFGIFNGSAAERLSLEIKPDPAERESLLQDSRFYVPPYNGAYGWLALDLAVAEPDLQEVAELLESSYRQVALKRMLKALDAR